MEWIKLYWFVFIVRSELKSSTSQEIEGSYNQKLLILTYFRQNIVSNLFNFV